MQNTSGPLKCNISKNRIKNLGYSKFRYAGLDIIKTINGINPKIIFSTFKDVSKDLMNLRMIKSKEEIEIIKNAPRIIDFLSERDKEHFDKVLLYLVTISIFLNY